MPPVDGVVPRTPTLPPDVAVAWPRTPMPLALVPHTPRAPVPFRASPDTPLPPWALDSPRRPAVSAPGIVAVTMPLNATALGDVAVVRTTVAAVPVLSWPTFTGPPLAAEADG